MRVGAEDKGKISRMLDGVSRRPSSMGDHSHLVLTIAL